MNNPSEIIQSIKTVSANVDETLREISALNDKILLATARLVTMNRMLGKITEVVGSSE